MRGTALAVGSASLALTLAIPLRAGTATCGPDVDVTLSTEAPKQGGLVLVEVKSAAPLQSVNATAAGQNLRFWKENSETHRALLGIDLELKPTTYPLAIEAHTADGRKLGCSVAIAVADGRFAVERLKVASKYVELSPKDLARSKADNRRLAAAYASSGGDRYWEGPFQLPLEGASGNGSFGKRRVLNGQPRSPHGGEDFPAKTGTPVHSPAGGRVVLAGDLFFTGNTVVVDHGLGLLTLYAHLDSLAVEEGARVERGALLGRIGATGRVTGPHLHWAARLGKIRVNPMELVALR